MKKFNKCLFCDLIKYTPYHVTEINKDGVPEKCLLCQACGDAYIKELDKKPAPPISFEHIDTPEQLLEYLAEIATIVEPRCQCGWTLSDFNRTGRLSCSHCYDTFGERLEAVIHKWHGAVVHEGKRPKSQAQPESEDLEDRRKLLKLRLAKAVELEQFERAAEYKQELDGLSPPSPA